MRVGGAVCGFAFVGVLCGMHIFFSLKKCRLGGDYIT